MRFRVNTAAALAGTWLSSRSPFSNPGALLNLSGQTSIVPRADGTIAVTPKPLGVTTGVYEEAGDDLWREVGGDAVAYTEPDPASIAAALTALLDDPDRRAELAAAGHERSLEFTWTASAEAHMAAFRLALEP